MIKQQGNVQNYIMKSFITLFLYLISTLQIMWYEGQVAYLTYEKQSQNFDLKTQLERQVKRPSIRRKENIKTNPAMGVTVWLEESISSWLWHSEDHASWYILIFL